MLTQLTDLATAIAARELPTTYTPLPHDEWGIQVDKIHSESSEALIAAIRADPADISSLLDMVQEGMDVFIATSVLLLRSGVDPLRMLEIVMKYNLLRADYGMEGGKYTHSPEVKKRLHDEMKAEMINEIWGKK